MRTKSSDGNDSNDSEEDAYRVLEVGSWCELSTYILGIGIVAGAPDFYNIPELAEGSWYAELAAMIILVVMTAFTFWCAPSRR